MHYIDPTSPDQASPPPLALAPREAAESPAPDLLDVLLIVLVAAAALFFCIIVAKIVLLVLRGPHAIDPRDPAGSVLLFLPVQLAAYIVTVSFMVLLVRLRHHTPFLKAVRWNMPTAKFVWAALLGGSALGLTSTLLEVLLHRWIPKSLPIEQYFSTPASAYALTAFGILVAPLVEELFFRGFLYPALARWTGSLLAIGLTAGLFALVHAAQLALAWAPLLILFAVGAVLTTVRARTNSVALCVLIHVGYNFTLFTMLFFATSRFHHMERM